MATARAMLERRRSSRVRIRIPVTVFSDGTHGEPLNAAAETTAISRCGAMLRTSFSPPIGSRIQVTNGLSKETREFRVIRVSKTKEDGVFELGVEILYPLRDFWGVRFPGEPPSA